MTGPEHYREAERLVELAESVDWQDGDADRPNRAEYAQTVLAAAQVHATLALTAATANVERPDTSPLAERPSAWDRGRPGDHLTWSEVVK